MRRNYLQIKKSKKGKMLGTEKKKKTKRKRKEK